MRWKNSKISEDDIMTSDEDKIRTILKARQDAVTKGDAKAALASLASDVVVYDLPPPLLQKR